MKGKNKVKLELEDNRIVLQLQTNEMVPGIIPEAAVAGQVSKLPADAGGYNTCK